MMCTPSHRVLYRQVAEYCPSTRKRPIEPYASFRVSFAQAPRTGHGIAKIHLPPPLLSSQVLSTFEADLHTAFESFSTKDGRLTLRNFMKLLAAAGVSTPAPEGLGLSMKAVLSYYHTIL